jgi:hypothetical protein
MIADASIDQDVVVRRLDDKTLDTEQQPVVRIHEFRPQPSAVLVEQVFGKRRKKWKRFEESTLLLDDGMNGDVVHRKRLGHVSSTLGRRSEARSAIS